MRERSALCVGTALYVGAGAPQGNKSIGYCLNVDAAIGDFSDEGDWFIGGINTAGDGVDDIADNLISLYKLWTSNKSESMHIS